MTTKRDRNCRNQWKAVRAGWGIRDCAQAVALMREGQVIDVGLNLALNAAANGLPMADSLIYATAQAQGAILWTQDQHFEELPGVRYMPKNSAA